MHACTHACGLTRPGAGQAALLLTELIPDALEQAGVGSWSLGEWGKHQHVDTTVRLGAVWDRVQAARMRSKDVCVNVHVNKACKWEDVCEDARLARHKWGPLPPCVD